MRYFSVLSIFVLEMEVAVCRIRNILFEGIDEIILSAVYSIALVFSCIVKKCAYLLYEIKCN